MTELKLNNFEGFDKILFGDSKPYWDKFYDVNSNTFRPPILDPKTEAEHQIDHYALWMVIASFSLIRKPIITLDATVPLAKCYACEWRRVHCPELSCKYGCPLTANDGCTSCGRDYDIYNHIAADLGVCQELGDAAERVAKFTWR